MRFSAKEERFETDGEALAVDNESLRGVCNGVFDVDPERDALVLMGCGLPVADEDDDDVRRGRVECVCGGSGITSTVTLVVQYEMPPVGKLQTADACCRWKIEMECLVVALLREDQATRSESRNIFVLLGWLSSDLIMTLDTSDRQACEETCIHATHAC